MDLAERMRAALTVSRRTVGRVAAELEVSASVVEAWLAGEACPSSYALSAFARITDTDVAWLRHGDRTPRWEH